MKKINVNHLSPNDTLEAHLFSLHGLKLVPRGTLLNRDILDALAHMGRDFILADDVRSLASARLVKQVDADAIKPGMRVPDGLVSVGGYMLAETADQVDVIHAEMAEHGLFQQIEREPRPTTSHRHRLVEMVVEARSASWSEFDESILESGEEFDFEYAAGTKWPDRDALLSWRAERAAQIRREFARMLAGVVVDTTIFERIIEELMEMLRRDPVRFPQIALLCPTRHDYLPDHALSTAALGMIVAAREGYSREGVRLVGLASLLHDVGMLLVPERVRTTNAQGLSQTDQQRVVRHPAYSVFLLEEVKGIPGIVTWTAYRHHERDDGSGYPAGLKRTQIGKLPRLLAVCDVAAAMLGNRPFRMDMLPHEAVHELVELGRAGKLNRADIRRVVDCVGLYPVGSYVRMSTGEGAQVIGNHPGAADRPLVRVCDRNGHATRREIDLVAIEPHKVSILRGIPRAEAARRVFHNLEESPA